MDIQNRWMTRAISLGLALALIGAPDLAGAIAQQDAGAGTQTQAPTAQQPMPSAEPSTPGDQPVPLPDAPSAAQPQTGNETAPDAGKQDTTQKTPAPKSQPSQQPAGAAAAQQAPTSGGAASKPAGMAIAPAKQRQVRSLLIKLGAIAGGAVAIGTVVALTKASPSKPPGAK